MKVVVSITIFTFIIGLIAGILIYKSFFSSTNDGLLIWMYYFFQILGGIGTCLAVVVALFKDSIKNLLWHPDFSFKLVDDGITEVIDHDMQMPTTDLYQCVLEINNKGNDSAVRCDVVVDSVKYAIAGSEVFDTIHKLDGTRKLDWGADNIVIPEGKSKTISLFNIERSTSTPQEEGVSQQQETYMIKLNGPTVESQYCKAGTLIIDYCLNYSDGKYKCFSVKVTGDGQWRSRKEELKRFVKPNLLES